MEERGVGGPLSVTPHSGSDHHHAGPGGREVRVR